MNYAQNILHGGYAPHEDTPVLTCVREGATSARHYTLRELRIQVARIANALRDAGVCKGDRVACVCAHSGETFMLFLAATSLGTIFTSCSPETGGKGILDRFVQVRPKVLFADDHQVYNGKRYNHLAKIHRVVHELRAQFTLVGVVIVPRFQLPSTREQGSWQYLDDFISRASEELTYVPCAFDDPMVIVYSSGTTGQPKCLVHTVGGVLLKQKSEQVLCLNLRPGSVYMQYTTVSLPLQSHTRNPTRLTPQRRIGSCTSIRFLDYSPARDQSYTTDRLPHPAPTHSSRFVSTRSDTLRYKRLLP